MIICYIVALFYNGGGVVAILELSRLLVSTGEKKYTIVFVVFDFHYRYKYKGKTIVRNNYNS